jgi:predicted nuclease of predicted toxin-antitoxin system
VKLLLDKSLSIKLVARVDDLFPGSIHVSSVGLRKAANSDVFHFAQRNKFAIVTVDPAFYDLAVGLGLPHKVIWLYPKRDAESLLRGESARIFEFLQDPERIVMLLER